jgi:hypothetical protein
VLALPVCAAEADFPYRAAGLPALWMGQYYGYAWAILAYAMPHIFLAQITNSRVQGHYRLSFWNEIYEAVLAPYILYPTILALINPKLGKFNVTVKERHRHRRSALLLLG